MRGVQVQCIEDSGDLIWKLKTKKTDMTILDKDDIEVYVCKSIRNILNTRDNFFLPFRTNKVECCH